MKFLALVIRNLLRNRRRLFLTVASVAFSIFIFVVLISLPALVASVLRDRAASLRLITHSRAGLLYGLPMAYQSQIEAIAHVDAVSPYQILVGTYRDPSVQIAAAAIGIDHVPEIFPDWGVSAADLEAFRHSRKAILLSAPLMKLNDWHVGDNVTLHGVSVPIDAEFTVVGRTGDKAPARAIIMRFDYLDELLGRPGITILYWVKIDRSSSANEVIQAIDARFGNSAFATQTETESQLVRNTIAGYWLLFDGAKFLAVIVIFSIAMVAANTAAMAARERRHELGVMRAMGFTRVSLVALFAGEGLAVGLAGGTLGCILARGGFAILPYAAKAIGPLALALQLSWRSVVGGFVAATVLGIASALVPAALATRGEISDELRAI
jgi:putative ABC transport system permease protein